MKTLAVLSVFAALMSTNISGKKEMYYFGISHSKNSSTEQGKETVLLTPVKFLVAEEEYTKSLSKAWSDEVQKNCNNSNGCTSDFNYYFDEKSAGNAFEKAQKHYSDTSRYVIKNIGFKVK